MQKLPKLLQIQIPSNLSLSSLHPTLRVSCTANTCSSSAISVHTCVHNKPASAQTRLLYADRQTHLTIKQYASGPQSPKSTEDPKSTGNLHDSITEPVMKSETVDKPPLTIYGRFKQLSREYGKTLIAVHTLTACCWYGSFYLVAYSGMDLLPFLETVGAGETIMEQYRAAGDYLVAYLLYTLAKPIRYLTTLTLTQLIVRRMKKAGLLAYFCGESAIFPGSVNTYYLRDAVEEVKIPAPPKEQKAATDLSREQIYESLKTINEQERKGKK